MVKSGFGKLTSLNEAIKILLANTSIKEMEPVKLEDALGRILAEDVIALIDVPHFDKSAMDGYAVISQDTFGTSNTLPKTLRLIGSVLPGQVFEQKIISGECVEIATGAPLPDGVDAVLMVEYTERTNNHITIYKSVAPVENVIKIGADVKKGEKILNRGTTISPRHIGVLAAVGISYVKVFQKPKVAVLATGSEIIKQGEKLEKGKVYDVNSQTLSAGLKENNCEVIDFGFVSDEFEIIKNRIIEGIKKSDIVLLSGGSSLGASDLIIEVLNELGKILIHGIAVKPGKPTIIAKVKNKLVIGLPGHPMSCLSNFYIFILPVLRKMSGCCYEISGRYIEAVLTRKVASTIGRYEFLPVKIIQKENKIYAEPIMKGSSAITSITCASGFIEIDENTEVIEKGEKVKVRLF